MVIIMSWKNDQVSEAETQEILRIAQECLLVPGDFVELGCYKGDTSLLLAETLWCGAEASQELVKRLWIYDSFEGLPEKQAEDMSVMGEEFKEGELYVAKREVKERFLRANLPVPVIKKGWFKDFKDADLPERIAFSFIDGDFYTSIRDGLLLVQDKMAPGGVIIVHDYANPALPGVNKAVDEWIRGKDAKMRVFQSMVVINLV